MDEPTDGWDDAPATRPRPGWVRWVGWLLVALLVAPLVPAAVLAVDRLLNG